MNEKLEVSGIGSESLLTEMESLQVLGGGGKGSDDPNMHCVNQGCEYNRLCTNPDCPTDLECTNDGCVYYQKCSPIIIEPED